jgi:hypothetical protein
MEPNHPPAVDITKLYPHEIKSKRILKELSMLSEEHFNGVMVGKPYESSIGLHIPVDEGYSLDITAAQEPS